MTTDALAEELKLVEKDLTRFRETAADLRRRIGDRDEELLRRLGQPIRTNGS